MAERKTSRSEEFRQRFRTFFSRSGGANSPSHTPPPSPAGITPASLGEDLIADMGPDSTLTVMQRAELIHNAREAISSREPINSSTLVKFWAAVSDLFVSDQEAPALDASWGAMIDMLRYQPLKIGPLAEDFGRQLSEYIASTEEDVERKILALTLLTDDGFSVTSYLESVDVVLFQLMQEACKWNSTERYVRASDLVEKSLRHGGQDWLSPEYRILMLKHVCSTSRSLAASAKPPLSKDLGPCIRLVQSLLEEQQPASPSPASLPPPQRPAEAALSEILRCCCMLVGDKNLHGHGWDISKGLLGDPTLCDQALDELCAVITESDNVFAVRGALFHAGMALWGCNALPALSSADNTRRLLAPLTACLARSFDCYSPLRPQGAQDLVLDEVLVSLGRLLRKHADFVCRGEKDQVSAAWNLILQLLRHLVNAFTDRDPTDSLSVQKCMDNLLNLLTTVESLYADEKIPTELRLPLIEIFERCVRIRSEDSIMLWMSIRMEHIATSPEEKQVEQVKALSDMYFSNETEEAVRIKAICLLITHFTRLHSLALDIQFRMVETVLLPMIDFFPTISEGHSLRVKVIQLFIVCVDQLDQIRDREEKRKKKLIVRFCSVMSDILTEGRIESAEVEAVVHEYIRIFMRTWQQNNVLGTCVRVFDQLCDLLKKFYFDSPISLRTLQKDEVQRIRELKLKLFSFFLDFRSSSSNVLDHESRSSRLPSRLYLSPPDHPRSMVPKEEPRLMDDLSSTLNFDWVMKMTLHCIRQELDWVVLRLVLEKLSVQLEHWFIVRHFPKTISKISCTLCDMIRNRSLCMPAKLYEGPRLQQFHGHVLAPISRLISFSYVLDRLMQKQLLECLFFGIVSPYNKECIGSLTLALLEMPETIRSLLPAIVLKISQIASNPDISAYVLEFLSTLVYLPQLYSEFTEEQFLSIFAIAVPYTNPFRFNNYIVATAYRVITAWYVRCHQPFRKTFSSFINKGLKSHVMRNFEEHEEAESRRSGFGSADPAACGFASLESSTSEPRKARGRTMHVIGLNLRRSAARVKPRRSRSPPSTSSSDLHVSATLPLAPPRRPTLGSPPMPRKSCSVSVAPSATVAARLHRELTEICADMLARFAFSSVATMPRRSDVSERLLAGGPHKSWLVGPTQVVTITTSADFQPGPNGLCSRCTELFGLKEDEVKQPKQDNYQGLIPPFLRSAPRYEPPPEERLCWCSGWAEITIHRPSGITSWMTRLQNPQTSVECAASGPLASSLPLQIAHLCRKTLHVAGGGLFGASQSPVLHDRMREAQYRELHRQQFSSSSGGESDVGAAAMTIPGRNRALGPRVRALGGSAESLSPLESPGELARSPSLPQLALQEEEEEKKEGNAYADTATGTEEARLRSKTVPNTPSEGRLSRNSMTRIAARRSSVFRSSYGLNPSFVFMQLYYSHAFGNVENDIMRPLPLIESDHLISFSLSQLSEVPVYETHCVGVIYVHPGQANDESAIFANQSGSARYNDLLSRLGQPVNLSQCDAHSGPFYRQYVGDLDTKRGEDGQWTVVWNEELLQLAFHVTTLMPPATSPANKQYKKRHVGNDYVTIVYNDSGEPYKLGTITGQFQFVNIVVAPLPEGFNHVMFVTRDNGVADLLGSLQPRVVSDAALGRFLRVCALHANLASLIVTRQRLDPASPFTNCWLERLRRIRRLRHFALERKKPLEPGRVLIKEDFSDIVH